MKSLSESEFNMWRCLIALAHVDKKLHMQEFLYLSEVFENLSLSQDQFEALVKDLSVPQDVKKMFLNIKEKEFKTRFFHLARILSQIDANYSQVEMKTVESLQELYHDEFTNVGSSVHETEEEYQNVISIWTSASKKAAC